MTDSQTQRVIVVLSSGRAGTSLLMKILQAFGLRLSANMIPGSVGNPDGFFEDTEIVDVHKNLFRDLNSSPTMPLPDNWLESSPAKKYRQILKKILQERVGLDNSLWGFKDPRTASFLPLWNGIFNTPGVVPVFLLALRSPAQVAISMRRQVNRSELITELEWLSRITDALYHTAADCFIVHYEDWFQRPVEQVRELLDYTGLGQHYNADIESTLKEIIRPKFNRAVHENYDIQNKYVLDLYNSIKNCKGINFDADQVLNVVKECRVGMNSFRGWAIEAHKALSQKGKNVKTGQMKKVITENDRLIEENKALSQQEKNIEAEVKKVIIENNRLLKEHRDFFDENDTLRKQVSSIKGSFNKEIQPIKNSLTQKDKDIAQKRKIEALKSDSARKQKALERNIIVVKNSYAFRLGRVLIDAVAKPGKNTVLMPYFLLIIFWDIITGKGRIKTA